MAKYRKKPVVIDARQFTEEFDLMRWCETVHTGSMLSWRFESGSVFIPTLEGEMRADKGDWIIRGVAGEFYPCKSDIFAATYEPV